MHRFKNQLTLLSYFLCELMEVIPPSPKVQFQENLRIYLSISTQKKFYHWKDSSRNQWRELDQTIDTCRRMKKRQFWKKNCHEIKIKNIEQNEKTKTIQKLKKN